MARKHSRRMVVQSASVSVGGTWTASKTLMAVAIGLYVLTRFYLLFYARSLISDIGMYRGYAINAVDLKQTPYTEDFEVPYPPLAFWTTLAPRYFDDRRITNPQDPQQVIPIIFDYNRGFRGMMFMCDLASFTMLLLILRKRRAEMAPWAAMLYVITTTILGDLLFDRLDVGLLMFMILGAYCWTRTSAKSRRSIAWATLSYAILGLGISFKVIPVLCVPFFLLADFHAPRRFLRLGLALPVLAATISVPFLIQWAATGPSVFDIFKFHAEREIHLESLYSSLMSIASVFGAKIYVSFSHGAYNLSGDFSGAMKILSTILLLGFLGGEGLWALTRWSRYNRQEAYRMACYAVSGSVILVNVLSPQYFIWAIPLLLLLAVEIFPEGYARPLILAGLLIVVAATTSWVFPHNFFASPEHPHALIPEYALKIDQPPQSLAAFILGLRNFTYLGVVIWLGVMLYKRIDAMEIFSKSQEALKTGQQAGP